LLADIKDFKSEFHGFFLCSEFSSGTFKLLEFLESFHVVIEALINVIWSLVCEVLFVVLAFFLEVFNRIVNFSLELGIAFLDNDICFIKAVVKFEPGIIKTFKLKFVFI